MRPSRAPGGGGELVGAPDHLDRAVDRSVRQRAPDDATRLVDPVLAPRLMDALVDEQDPPARRQEAVQDAPERRERPRRHMGEEEAEEDRVVSVRRLHGERVGDLVADVRPIPRPRSVELEHLGRRIGDEQLLSRLGQDAGPLSRAGCQLEHSASGHGRTERVADPIGMRLERIALGDRCGVVFARPRAVVGDLLVDQLAIRVHQRRSAGTPSVTAAATVAVASARAWLAVR